MKKRKTTKAEFALFKRECEKWRRRLNLLDWEFYYERGDVDDNFATIKIDYLEHNASLAFSDTYHPGLRIHVCAKHECIHVLLGGLGQMAKSRDFTPSDIQIEMERVVKLLTELI